MTRQHFKLIARTIYLGDFGYSNESPAESHAAAEKRREAFAREMASSLAETNPCFDREKFIHACMTGEGC